MGNFKNISLKILVTVIICIVFFTVYGCKKCRECTSKLPNGNVVATEEECGTNEDLKAFENVFRINNQWYEIECIDK